MKRPRLLPRVAALAMLLSVLFAAPQTQAQLSEHAFASVLTCGAGNEFYSTFGHSAIRICDTSLNIDYVYNYGTFDFDTPHFYLRFAQGRLDYCLGRSNFPHFLFSYAYEGRSVWEQRLRLSHQEVCNLFVLLETNYQPEYRYYRYDFFRDNCATRVRDMVNGCLTHRTLFVEQPSGNGLSYRQIIYPATEENLLWWRLGVDLCLGQRCDHHCSNLEAMFSPFEIMTQLDTTRVSDTGLPLAEPAVKILQETREPLSRSISPTLCFWVFFILVFTLTLASWHKGWRMGWMDVVIFAATSIVSLLLLALWFFSMHYCTKLNWNILWASPLFIYFAIRLRRSRPWLICFQGALLLLVMLGCIISWPQGFNAAVFPIALTLLVRLIANLRHRTR